MTGLFVSIDGPGGVGKSTVTALVAEELRAAGAAVLATREPSDTALGRLARNGTDDYRGLTMACLIAADRHADMPDLAVILNARAEVLDKRLTSRGAHSRYERAPGGPARECAAFREAARFLMAAGVRVVQCDASTDSPQDVARRVLAAVRDIGMRGSP
ncbi:dTMP kinase [Actinacidiphila epipremni]|uniref:dTMP kinase n=1 Tax=Actinacidiphila epipremni TaxID=2053013 RepID=UPI002AFE7903|nr:dTMP kinase [Actinacidiphila epipremni]